MTYSRYDFMKEGAVLDEVTRTTYPDPLSLNYSSLKLQHDVPIQDIMTGNRITFFWKEAENIYGVAGYDDVVLSLNNIPHRNFLQEGETIYFPALKDIKDSFDL